jgi:hypothetical protein
MEKSTHCKSNPLHSRREVKVTFNDFFLTAVNQANQDKKRKTNKPVLSANKKLCGENFIISKQVCSAMKKPENDIISKRVEHELKNSK